MNSNFKIYAFMTLVLSAVTFAGATYSIAQKPRELRTANIEPIRRGMLPGVVTAANQQSFQIGKDFACAIDDSIDMASDVNQFNYSVVDLVYLIDELEGQPEATQLQGILKGIVRQSKELTQVSREINEISKAYFAKQSVEKKWYFNVGAAQMKLLIAGWANDSQGTLKGLKDLQDLVRTAPQGSPQIVLDAIKGLSKYAVKVNMATTDFDALVTDTKIITTLVYA